MATALSETSVRDTSLQETTVDKTDNGIVVSARHPAWLRALCTTIPTTTMTWNTMNTMSSIPPILITSIRK